ncbi:HAD family phosphatase [Phormidium tenue FACHB-886]|nr:HAD family phosphatase [Phormidium tenue FACHB-886]
MNLPYSAIIFDCDGTLANTLPVHFRVWSTILQERGTGFSEVWYQQHCGLSGAEMLQRLQEQFGYQIDLPAIRAEQRQLFDALIHTVEEIQVVADVARSHVGKMPIAVASGGSRINVETTLKAVGLRDLFETIVTINDVSRGKPAPDLFLLAAERLGVEPAACLVYEDSDGGLEAARRAGMRSIDVRSLLSA